VATNAAEPTRRDFIHIATGTVAAIGVGLAAWPFIDQMNPDAATIAAADGYGLPVSTTHVLSSGIAGTMAASGSGLQWSTIRNIALAWVLTLPAAMILSGCLYFMFSHLF